LAATLTDVCDRDVVCLLKGGCHFCMYVYVCGVLSKETYYFA